MDASAPQTGLSPTAEPVPVSSADAASIPSAGTCDVCRLHPAVGVASSALGPVSWAYCSTCLENNAEPICMIEATVDGCDGLENIASWCREGIQSFADGEYISFDNAASAIETRRAEMRSSSVEDESAAPKADAQSQSEHSS